MLDYKILNKKPILTKDNESTTPPNPSPLKISSNFEASFFFSK